MRRGIRRALFSKEPAMTTLAQDLYYQQARLEWREAMHECLAQFRRVSVIH